MGFFDTVKDKAGALAADAERAGKVTAAQARLVVLQNDLRKAERELGHAAFALVERGELDHPELAAAVARLRATAAEVQSKEAEIAALRGGAPEDAGAAVTTPFETPAPDAAGPPASTTPVADEPAAAETEPPAAAQPAAAEPPVEAPPKKKAAATKTAAKGPAAKKAAAKKPAAKKPAANRPAAPATTATPKPRVRTTKGGAGASAGATPKKPHRPSSSGPRPAGKKKPAGS
jgi:hypothetical protein